MNRRDFCYAGTSCAAHVWFAAALMPHSLRRAFGARVSGSVVRREPWGSLEQLSDNVWAMISTPLAGGDDARRTLANGGIVAGRSGVLVVEGFYTEAGAQWVAESALELTGRRPTHVVLTHYHGDHSAGLAGYRANGSGPQYVTTERTRSLLSESAQQQGRTSAVALLLSDAELVEPGHAYGIDLGGVRVTVTPRSGHTPSDLAITVEDPHIVFGGDLLWNGMFPNYRDAIPSVLSREVRAMLGDRTARYVPGHGSIPTDRELRNYVELLDVIEQAARRAHASGTPADAAAREFTVPSGLGEWFMFSDRYYEVALSAWERELGR